MSHLHLRQVQVLRGRCAKRPPEAISSLIERLLRRAEALLAVTYIVYG